MAPLGSGDFVQLVSEPLPGRIFGIGAKHHFEGERMIDDEVGAFFVLRGVLGQPVRQRHQRAAGDVDA